MSFNSNDFKGFTFRSGPVKNKVKQNSTFWDTNSNDVDVDEFLGLDTDTKKGKDLVALAGYKRAISNFVNIVTEDSIPVVFNSDLRTAFIQCILGFTNLLFLINSSPPIFSTLFIIVFIS